jgi:hypothetical protein
MVLTNRNKVHHHPGLIAVGIGNDHACAIGIDLEQRADGGIQFRIHQDHVFAVGWPPASPAPELDLPGGLDHRVDIAGPAQGAWHRR